jgi:hypothetical protein
MMRCVFCGCSDHDACPEGCGWARGGARPVCTACQAIADAFAELTNRILERVGPVAPKVRAQLKRAGAAAAQDVR